MCILEECTAVRSILFTSVQFQLQIIVCVQFHRLPRLDFVLFGIDNDSEQSRIKYDRHDGHTNVENHSM